MARKINQHKTTYYKEVAASVTVLFIIIFFVIPIHYREDTVIHLPSSGGALETSKEEVEKVPEHITEKEALVQRIKHYFPRSGETMVAIAKAESKLNNNAVGYNCFYNAYETIVYEIRVSGSHSTHCKAGHQKYAWSVDCFVLQKNYPGRKSCPKDVTLDEHLEEVAELSRVQGLEAWSSYNNGSFRGHITNK